MDPEALVECPYDKSHRVRGSRLPYHLVKCQRNNPRLARALAACPFNARHRVPQAKLQSHIATCPDKHQPDLPHEVDTSCGNRMKQPEVPTAWQGPPCQEDWEAELEDLEDPPPFILNVGTNDLLLPYESTMFPGTPRSPRRAGSSAQRIGMRGCPGLSWRNTFPAHPPRTQIPSPRGAGASPHRRAETFPHALPAGGKPSESLPAPAVSCVLRTVPITALQHLPADFAQRVDPAGHETRHVSTPSHGSRSPGGRLPSPPGMGRGDQRRRETQSSRRDPSLPPRSGSRYRLGAGSCPRAGTSRAWPRLLGQPGSAG
ncbi:gametocyte-specific factor 1 isoform X4 [Phalacrocorax carbo]|uniref:gametocyte-specific factor 1 isoform X4 n=1 Tax=Phalacrocorax carbo TaxID=9209 RepID=UPI0031196572